MPYCTCRTKGMVGCRRPEYTLAAGPRAAYESKMNFGYLNNTAIRESSFIASLWARNGEPLRGHGMPTRRVARLWAVVCPETSA